jgi:hypothetical protein
VLGSGNADTIQQRARFLGYKRKYLGLCRAYLEQNLKAAFEDYVEHEQTMRTELTRLANTGESLRTWRRRLILDPSLQPCRRSVISDPYTRTRAGGGWTPQRGALLTPSVRQSNADVLARLCSGLPFRAEPTDTSEGTAGLGQSRECRRFRAGSASIHPTSRHLLDRLTRRTSA